MQPPRPRRGVALALTAALVAVGLPSALGENDSPPVAAACGAFGSERSPGTSNVGGLTEARSLFVSREREVSADEDTMLLVLAVASATGERIAFEDVVSYREERIEVCVHDRLATLDARTTMSALLLGVSERGELRELVEERHVVVRYESIIEQEVRLDKDVAFAALAFEASVGGVSVHDVLDVRRSERVERTFEARTDLDRDAALLALALEERE